MANVALLVEGSLDETVGRRLATFCGHTVSIVYGKQGFGYIRTNIAAFNATASGISTIALADSMDMHEPCPPGTLHILLPNPHPRMRFRLAVREIESWLLADRANLAAFLGVPVSRMPENPDAIRDPKLTLMRAARGSSRPTVRRLIPPQPGYRSREGPGYTSEMQRFALNTWDIAAACARSDSLRGCIASIRTLT